MSISGSTVDEYGVIREVELEEEELDYDYEEVKEQVK